MRNKSGLYPAQRSMVHDELPYPEPMIWTHHTLAYARRMYGRYGKSSGVNPSMCWPTKAELTSKREWERIAYPLTIPQMVENVHREKREKEERKQARQDDIIKKMASLGKMKQDLFNRIAKKEADMLAIKVSSKLKFRSFLIMYWHFRRKKPSLWKKFDDTLATPFIQMMRNLKKC